jgi:hypothetical protein
MLYLLWTYLIIGVLLFPSIRQEMMIRWADDEELGMHIGQLYFDIMMVVVCVPLWPMGAVAVPLTHTLTACTVSAIIYLVTFGR